MAQPRGPAPDIGSHSHTNTRLPRNTRQRASLIMYRGGDLVHYGSDLGVDGGASLGRLQ